jgi:hypothetical protein
MKRKKNNKKLGLKKTTVADLKVDELTRVKGRGDEPTIPVRPSCPPICPTGCPVGGNSC